MKTFYKVSICNLFELYFYLQSKEKSKRVESTFIQIYCNTELAQDPNNKVRLAT